MRFFFLPNPNRATGLPENENFLTNFHGFPKFRLEGSVCLTIMGTLKSMEFYKGSKSMKQQVYETN